METDLKRKCNKFLKKGHQALNILLGFLVEKISHGKNILTSFLSFGKNIFLFILAIVVTVIKFPYSIFINSKKILIEIWHNIKKTFYNTLGVIIAIFFASLLIIAIIILMKHISPNFINILSSKYIIIDNNYDIQTSQSINALLSKGKIISASDVYNNMLDYYNTLITILIALMGVFGIVSWISIQGKIKHETELSVDNKFENKDFQCRLGNEVETTANEIINEDVYISRIAENSVDLIISRLLCNKDFINKMKEVIQNFKDDENIKSKQLKGIEDGDEI